jgi:hypothetical protein
MFFLFANQSWKKLKLSKPTSAREQHPGQLGGEMFEANDQRPCQQWPFPALTPQIAVALEIEDHLKVPLPD